MLAPFGRRADVEEDELIGPLLGIDVCELHRIAGVAQRLELDSLDDSPGVHIEARNDPAHQHVTPPSHCNQRSTSRSPHDPDSSGWNWQPRTFPRSTAATKGPPWSLHATCHPGGRSVRR